MASRFTGASPAIVWILGYTTDDGCYLGFPNPNSDTSYNKIFFSNTEEYESYFKAFDTTGIKVWLQVEPGFADVLTLIDLAFTKYGHHSCIIGFGIDVEWYKTSSANSYEGAAVTDSEAETWSAKIKSYNQDYLLYAKHWETRKMPPTFRKDIVFVDDSQEFSNMSSMVQEFSNWAKTFAPAKVAFQFGYDADKVWWAKLTDPPKNIGDAILNECPNVSDLFWVDFTAYDIWPENFEPAAISDKQIIPSDYTLYQNYPNPFNPATIISYQLPKDGVVTLKVFDILGREVESLLNSYKTAGKYSVSFDASKLASGIYFYQLCVSTTSGRTGNFIATKKMVLLR
jgi:hypothetical protein